MSTRVAAPVRWAPAAAGLVVMGLLCQEVGASLAVLVFPSVGAAGMVTLRLSFSAIILLLVARPRMRGHGRAAWLTVIGFGVALAAMNSLFYQALVHLPLGAAVAIEMLGPLTLSVVAGRRVLSLVWAFLALVGIALFGWSGLLGANLAGVLFALGAGALWAAYILLSARTGASFPRLDGLAIAMSIAALGTLPIGIASAGARLVAPHIALIGLGVAVLSSAVPYGLELTALRTLPARTFSVLMSLAPAVAACIGLVILHQGLEVTDALAILFVVAAGVGAVLTTSPRPVPGAVLAPESPR